MNPFAWPQFILGFWLWVFDRKHFDAIELQISHSAEIIKFPERKGK